MEIVQEEETDLARYFQFENWQFYKTTSKMKIVPKIKAMTTISKIKKTQKINAISKFKMAQIQWRPGEDDPQMEIDLSIFKVVLTLSWRSLKVILKVPWNCLQKIIKNLYVVVVDPYDVVVDHEWMKYSKNSLEVILAFDIVLKDSLWR